jgi:hypothetical protein
MGVHGKVGQPLRSDTVSLQIERHEMSVGLYHRQPVGYLPQRIQCPAQGRHGRGAAAHQFDTGCHGQFHLAAADGQKGNSQCGRSTGGSRSTMQRLDSSQPGMAGYQGREVLLT